jgi:hypothetical protein
MSTLKYRCCSSSRLTWNPEEHLADYVDGNYLAPYKSSSTKPVNANCRESFDFGTRKIRNGDGDPDGDPAGNHTTVRYRCIPEGDDCEPVEEFDEKVRLHR